MIPKPASVLAFATSAALLQLPAAAQGPIVTQPPSQIIALFATVSIESNADNFVVTDPAGSTIETIRWWGTWDAGGAA